MTFARPISPRLASDRLARHQEELIWQRALRRLETPQPPEPRSQKAAQAGNVTTIMVVGTPAHDLKGKKRN